MTRETIAAAVMVWLIGAIVGWCAGWAARGEQNRGWHSNVVRQLAQALDELGDVRAELDEARTRWQPPPASAVVNVHVAAPLGWAAPQPLIVNPAQALTAVPALRAKEIAR